MIIFPDNFPGNFGFTTCAAITLYMYIAHDYSLFPLLNIKLIPYNFQFISIYPNN